MLEFFYAIINVTMNNDFPLSLRILFYVIFAVVLFTFFINNFLSFLNNLGIRKNQKEGQFPKINEEKNHKKWLNIYSIWGIISALSILLLLSSIGIFIFSKPKVSTIELTDNTEYLNMIKVESGTFLMGSPIDEPGRNSGEIQHRVTLNSFSLGAHEVTQAEYESIMGKNPSSLKGSNLPVTSVSWYDAIEFCNALSNRYDLPPAYQIDKNNADPNNTSQVENDKERWIVNWDKKSKGFRLPTEAEWEYACRAGLETPFNTGNNITTEQANYDGSKPYNNNQSGTTKGTVVPVNSYAPNRWGFFNMHGNVYEWCWDWYGNYSTVSLNNPSGPSTGEKRLIRGGGKSSSANSSRSAHRYLSFATAKYADVGFRVAKNN
jgi:formylglycine-generating enzyme required for sulfatase activity